MAKKTKNVLTLQIKKNFLDEILAGTKTEELRDVTPKNLKKYLNLQNENTEDETFEIIEYDSIQFFNGYATDRPEVLIGVKSSRLDVLTDEDDKEIEYTHEGETYVACVMVYELGEVLSRKNI